MYNVDIWLKRGIHTAQIVSMSAGEFDLLMAFVQDAYDDGKIYDYKVEVVRDSVSYDVMMTFLRGYVSEVQDEQTNRQAMG